MLHISHPSVLPARTYKKPPRLSAVWRARLEARHLELSLLLKSERSKSVRLFLLGEVAVLVEILGVCEA